MADLHIDTSNVTLMGEFKSAIEDYVQKYIQGYVDKVMVGRHSTLKNSSWDFSGDKSYTLNGECDIYYYRGSAGFLGIGSETSKARSCTKAIPYWYSTCIAAIRSSSGKFYASYSGIPDTSNTEIHSGWADANSTDPAQYVQYEYAFFQVSNDMAINTRRYFYVSGEGLTKTE